MRRLSVMDEEARKMAEFTGEAYSSVFKVAQNADVITSSTLMENNVGPRSRCSIPWIKSDVMKRRFVCKSHERCGIHYSKRPIDTTNTIDKIYDLIAKEEGQSFHDVQGDIYEEFLSEIASAGKNGQFRTPRHIIQMMATMLKPKLGETVGDPQEAPQVSLAAYQQVLAENISSHLNRQIDLD